MRHIVSVGADLLLLSIRSLVLAKTGASIQNAAPEQVLLLLDKRPVDLLILCHSTYDTARLCLAARMRAPAMKILLLESLVGIHPVSADVDERFQLENGPASLLHTVNSLLGGSKPNQPTSAASLAPVVRPLSRDSHKPASFESPGYAHSPELHTPLASTAREIIHIPSANLRCNTPSIIPFKANSSSES